MTEPDILAQAEELCNLEFPEYANRTISVKTEKGDTEVLVHVLRQGSKVAELLPQLLAEAKNLKRTRDNYCQEIKNLMRWREEDNHFYDEIFGEIEKEIDAWKAKAIEERAKSLYPFDSVFHCWSDVPEEDTVDGNCPIITIWGKKHWREVAAKELAEEMRQNG